MSFLKHILWFWVNLKVLFCNSYFTATCPRPLDSAVPALRELKRTMELEQVMVYNFELNHALSLVRSEVLNLALYSPSCSYSVIFLYLSRQLKHGAVRYSTFRYFCYSWITQEHNPRRYDAVTWLLLSQFQKDIRYIFISFTRWFSFDWFLRLS